MIITIILFMNHSHHHHHHHHQQNHVQPIIYPLHQHLPPTFGTSSGAMSPRPRPRTLYSAPRSVNFPAKAIKKGGCDTPARHKGPLPIRSKRGGEACKGVNRGKTMWELVKVGEEGKELIREYLGVSLVGEVWKSGRKLVKKCEAARRK